jgi:hypothetical protein
VDRSEGDYFTKLQQDGNLVSFKGTPKDPEGRSIWKINAKGAIGQYFLGIECDLKTLSIYEYMPEDPGELMWTSGTYTPVSDSDGVGTNGGDTSGGDTAGGDTNGGNYPEVNSRGKDNCDTHICALCEGDCDLVRNALHSYANDAVVLLCRSQSFALLCLTG